MSKIRIVSLSLASAVLAAGFANMATAADDISLRLNWKMKGEFTPFVVAAQKGYFKAEGLNVTVNEGMGERGIEGLELGEIGNPRQVQTAP